MSDQYQEVHQELVDHVTPSRNGQSVAADPAPAAIPAQSWYRRRWVIAAAVVAGLVGLVIGADYLRYAMTHESTDDAFIQAHVVTVSPKVASYVSRVHIDDNSHVRKGELLVELDPRDFETRLAQARRIWPRR